MTNILNLPSFFDHTNLKQDATEKDIAKLCQEAIDHKFYSVCVNPHYVKLSVEFLLDTNIKLATVIGFPLGMNKTETKLQEALLAINDGADELDMVVNIGLLKEHAYTKVENEIATIRKNMPYNKILKVIVESSQHTDIEIVEATKVVINSCADFIKTSTGFFGGATTNAVQLMNQRANGQIKIKASGGIKTMTDCQKMINAGASRLGCSASVAIMQEQMNNK